MTNAELWLSYQLASRAHLKTPSTTQLIELEFQNHKLSDLEDVLDHGKSLFREVPRPLTDHSICYYSLPPGVCRC